MLESLDSTILFAFTEEAQSYLPEIRRAVVGGALPEDVQLAFRHAHTIKGAAMMVGLDDVSASAGKIESILEDYVNEQKLLDENIQNQLTADIDCLEASLGEVVTALVRESKKQIVKSFIQVAALPEETHSIARSEETRDDYDAEEIDEEMLEVFAEEAEDLLQNIGEQLKILDQNAQSAVALGEIRRSSHTLKGAAAVCGFRTVARIAHRLEDLLDYLAENPFLSNARTAALILSTTDLLAGLTRGEVESNVKTEIERLFARFDETLSQTTLSAAIENNSPAKSYESHNENRNHDEFKIEHLAPPQTLPPAPQTNFAAIENADRTTGNSAEDTASLVQPASLKKTVVRVGLDRLDELVKLVGELVITRNALEQRLVRIETQLGEMSRNNRRLRNISGKLETDYEISTFSGNGFSANFPFNFSLDSSEINSRAENNSEFDALELDRYSEFHQLTRELSETASDAADINSELEDLAANLETVLGRQRRATEEMQEKLMRLRMVPLGTLHARLERTVRVTAEQENKLADFELEGADVELDTQVLDALTEPLLHLLRNSIAHGIESPSERERLGKSARGLVKLTISHEGTHVVFNIADDGRGFDLEAVRQKAIEQNFLTAAEAAALNDDEAAALVFLPGLSTAQTISEVAGRGVGMDAVRESVERQQGTISVKSKFGAGALVTIRLPMSLAVARALLVKSGDSIFAVPVGMIRQLTEIEVSEFEKSADKTLVFDGISHRHYSLNALLGFSEIKDRDSEYVPAIVLNSDEETIAVTFDQIIEAREIVIKPFDNLLRRVRGLLGATILGDGAVIPILDLFGLINRNEKQVILPTISQTQPPQKQERLSVLIVDDSTSVRRVMTNLMTKTGWHTTAAKDGIEALEMLQNARQLPDVILSDVEMPRMDGYEFVAALRQQSSWQQIPVVMITSRAGEKHRRKAIETGVAEYITKPYHDAFLIETIKKLFSQKYQNS